MTTHPYIGSSLDDFLEEDGILEEVDAIAIKRVLAWQVSQLMHYAFWSQKLFIAYWEKVIRITPQSQTSALGAWY